MSSNFTVDMKARFAQDMTASKAAMNTLLGTLRTQAAEDGEEQAIANLALAVTSQMAFETVSDLMLAAFHELAFGVEFADSEKTEQE